MYTHINSIYILYFIQYIIYIYIITEEECRERVSLTGGSTLENRQEGNRDNQPRQPPAKQPARKPSEKGDLVEARRE